MSTYTKHITHLSTDGLWELSFDVTATTPNEIISPIDAYSTITLSNGVVIYKGQDVYKIPSNRVGETSYINEARISKTIGNGGWMPDEVSYGDILGVEGNPNRPPTHFRNVVDFIIEHNENGIGNVSILYTIDFYDYAGVSGVIVNTVTFDFNFYLNTINITGKGLTEIGPEIQQAISEGSVAVKTRILFEQQAPTVSVLSETDDVEQANRPSLVVLTESDAIKTWELNDERYVPNTGFIGQFVARTLTGELHNISDDFSIENKDIELQMGIVQLGTRYKWLGTEDGEILVDEYGNRVYVDDLGDDITTWYSLGNFLVTKPEDDEVADNTKFEAFDYTTKFNVDFDAEYIDNVYTKSFNDRLKDEGGVTLHWLASYTCSQIGITFANKTFTNSDFSVHDNQFTQGESCRDVMKAIAQIAFGWCRIGWDNKCYIDEPQTVMATDGSADILTNDNYYSLTTQKQVFGPVNRVIIGMSGVTGQEAIVEDEESIAANGVTDILIMDNPILWTPELRESVKESSKKLFGLYYTPLETETPGHPWFKGNELINIKDMQGNSRFTYPFNRTIKYTGHIKTNLITPATTAQEKETEYKQQLFKTVRDIGIKVNAQEGRISTINSKTTANEDGLSALTTRFENEITDTYSKTQIQEIINGTAEDGTAVSSVKTTAGTFDKNGLTIEQTGSLTKTNINSNGMIIYNTSGTSDTDELLNVNSNGVDAKNIKVRQYLNIGSHSRMEDYIHDGYIEGTGVFWIGSDY